MTTDGAALRDEAIDRVGRHADEGWKRAAWDALLSAIRARRQITTDDVWARIPAGAGTHEPRAMGHIMQAAKRAGLIEPSDDWWLSSRPACHRRPCRVWHVVA